MRFSLVILALLLSVPASFACPSGYRSCGDGTLCCR